MAYAAALKAQATPKLVCFLACFGRKDTAEMQPDRADSGFSTNSVSIARLEGFMLFSYVFSFHDMFHFISSARML